MPINVTCPECQYQFLVGDEFAGRPGRCPECSTVIQVPAEEPPPRHDHFDPYPLHTPRGVEAFEEFPSRSRRRREDDYESDLRDDYDDRPNRSGSSSFNAESRAKAWARVHKGLGYIQIAVILYFFNQVLQTVFVAVHGFENNNDPNALPDSGEIAIFIGVAFIILFGIVFWIMGRLSMVKVPYVPARGWARASFYMVLGSIASFFGFCCLFTMAFVAIGGGGNGGALAMLMFALLIALLGMVLVVGGELGGLMALAKIGDGLKASSAANWARTSMVLMIVLMGIIFFGACGVGMYGAKQQKKKQEEQARQQRQLNPPPPGKDEQRPKGKNRDLRKDAPGQANNPPAGPNGQAQAQQPNPFEDDGLDEKTRLIVNGVMVGLILLFLVHYSISLQKGRRAIRAEIRKLTGEPDDVHDHRYEHD